MHLKKVRTAVGEGVCLEKIEFWEADEVNTLNERYGNDAQGSNATLDASFVL